MVPNAIQPGGARHRAVRPIVLALIVIVLAIASRGLTAAPLSTTSERLADAKAYWPGLLGPERDGWVGGFEPPAHWPDELTRAWQVEVGTGYGSPLVAEGHVYQHARQGDDEVLWCLDLVTGTTIWRQSHTVPFKIGGGGERHGKGPKSSPVLADGRVFTMSITGALTAWDADSGKQLWRRDYDSVFGKSHPYWGAATSPIVAGDLVLVHFGTDEAGTMAALDADSGQEVWTVTGDGPSYSSPLVVEIDGVRQVVEWNHQALVGIDIASGQSLWEFPFPHVGSDQNMPTPVFHRGRVLLGAENRGIHCLEPRLHDGAWSVEKVWSQEDVALNMSSAVVNDGLLFGFSHYDRGRFFSLDPATGQVLWKGPPRTGDNAALLSLPGHVLLLTDDGQLRIIRATGDGYEPVATYHVAEGDTWAPPVLLADGILVKALDTLTLWKLPGSPAADPPGE